MKRAIFSVSWTRCFVFRVGLLAPLAGVLLFGLAVGAGSLLVAGSALADTTLFRVEQSWLNRPNSPVTTPGGAGMYQGYIQPHVTKTAMGGNYYYPPAVATVQPGNPIGGKFTLPQSFIDSTAIGTLTPKTAWPGYTTVRHSVYYNGPGKFGPNNGATGPTRIVFPTTMGNPYPNHATGNPVSPTTIYTGRYDFSRAGSINVTPGPRRFGGTFRLFYRPETNWYQYVYHFSPAFYKGYFDFRKHSKIHTPTSYFVRGPCDTTINYKGTRFLLNIWGTGTGARTQSNSAKATTPTTPGGVAPTADGQGTPIFGAPASYITGAQRYLNLIHPWTTGFASVHNPNATPPSLNPHAQGYDTNLGGADIAVTRTVWHPIWNKTLSSVTTTTSTFTQMLYGVQRVVSMVRPRLRHTYSVSTLGTITTNRQGARMWMLKVFFLPEPGGMLMLGAGIAVLLGLSRMRRR